MSARAPGAEAGDGEDPAPATPAPAGPDVAAIPLAEEQLVVGKREVVTGRVRVTTATESFEGIARAELTREAVEVTRVAVGEAVTGPAPGVRQEGDVTVVPVFEEVLVVEKRLVLVEELHIRRRRSVEAVEEPVALRRQVARVERMDGEGP